MVYIRLLNDFIHIIFFAISLSHCSLLLIVKVHWVVIDYFVCLVPLIVVSQHSARIRCADSDIRVQSNLEVSLFRYVCCWSWCACWSCGCGGLLFLLFGRLMFPHPKIIPRVSCGHCSCFLGHSFFWLSSILLIERCWGSLIRYVLGFLCPHYSVYILHSFWSWGCCPVVTNSMSAVDGFEYELLYISRYVLVSASLPYVYVSF